jgi:acetyltransferase-like isoleucine patch superfamily enzyme
MVKVENLDKKLANFAFGSYTYFEKTFWLVLNFLPKILRKFFYRLLFKQFGKNVFIDEGCYFRYPWKISIGNNVTINRGCEFYPSGKDRESYIFLENGVILAPRVILLGAGQHPKNPSGIDVAGNIVLGENTYIGASAVIRYGVEIGKFSVVGAGSVVVKSVAERSVVAGNPAKFIRKN